LLGGRGCRVVPFQRYRFAVDIRLIDFSLAAAAEKFFDNTATVRRGSADLLAGVENQIHLLVERRENTQRDVVAAAGTSRIAQPARELILHAGETVFLDHGQDV